jgi:hypothetical protein
MSAATLDGLLTGDPHACCRSIRSPRSRSKPTPARSRPSASRLPRRRRQSPVARHPELRRCHAREDRPHPRRRRGAARDRRRAHALRAREPRPDVRPARQTLDMALADLDTAIGFGVQPPVVLPPHARAQHALRPQPAAAARRRHRRRHAGRSKPAWPPPASSTTKPPPSPARTVTEPPQPQLLDLRRLPRHRRRRPRQALQPRTTSGARRATSPSPRLPGRRGARRIHQHATGPSRRTDLPGEFMMNALRLNDGFPLPCSPNAPACRWRPSKSRRWRHGATGCWNAGRHTGRHPAADASRGERFLNQLLAQFLAD